MYINSTIFDKQNFYLTIHPSIHLSIHLSHFSPGGGKRKTNKSIYLLNKLYRYIRRKDFAESKKKS